MTLIINLLCVTTKPNLLSPLSLLHSPSFQLLPFFLFISSLVNLNPFFISLFPSLLISPLSPLPSHLSPYLLLPCLPPCHPLYLPFLPISLHTSSFPVFLLVILSISPSSHLLLIPSLSSCLSHLSFISFLSSSSPFLPSLPIIHSTFPLSLSPFLSICATLISISHHPLYLTSLPPSLSPSSYFTSLLYLLPPHHLLSFFLSLSIPLCLSSFPLLLFAPPPAPSFPPTLCPSSYSPTMLLSSLHSHSLPLTASLSPPLCPSSYSQTMPLPSFFFTLSVSPPSPFSTFCNLTRARRMPSS